ncbi:hypothetical protein SAMN02800692_0892 [Luteibacter sp. UNC138MFCol5.1]|uniref:hypothetical protein n=1 Tax=Luteibacter sp. UNC138MFCol5.1 TaxID=1502774 RepID=UPI0008BEB6C7|nr:hypothetical protein [Luteibacter sp. UNC138MFCol5.1]SEO46091.1 hypothetical protein SAMN02800692_0892 [Luteibacter sp. UNC138MFCol5.1]
MRFVFPPIRRSRNPLVRALSLVLGLAAVGVLLVFGVVVIGVLFAGGLAFFAVRQWKLARGRPVGAQASAPKDPDVLEGEFVVIRQGQPVHHH